MYEKNPNLEMNISWNYSYYNHYLRHHAVSCCLLLQPAQIIMRVAEDTVNSLNTFNIITE
jgi:hypothetical protein